MFPDPPDNKKQKKMYALTTSYMNVAFSFWHTTLSAQSIQGLCVLHKAATSTHQHNNSAKIDDMYTGSIQELGYKPGRPRYSHPTVGVAVVE